MEAAEEFLYTQQLSNVWSIEGFGKVQDKDLAHDGYKLQEKAASIAEDLRAVQLRIQNFELEKLQAREHAASLKASRERAQKVDEQQVSAWNLAPQCTSKDLSYLQILGNISSRCDWRTGPAWALSLEELMLGHGELGFHD